MNAIWGFISLLLLATQAISQSLYSPGDWVSYRDFRYAVSVDATSREVFFATTGGILSYDILKQKWYEPMVVGYGFSEAVPIENPQLILYDDNTNFLWVSTPFEILQYNALNESWRRIENNLWPSTERAVNIGVGGNSIYIETIPAALFPLLFNGGTPIPSAEWQEHITRYKGTRNFGGFMLDNTAIVEPDTRWRGLRSKVWPDKDKFPIQTLPQGYIFKSNGTVLDPNLYEYPATDWITDPWGTLWTCHWGMGLMKSDTRNFQSEIFSLGPAGSNLKRFSISGGFCWMGGDSQGDHVGISRVSYDLKTWSAFTLRDDANIRSTKVNDFAFFDNREWVATMDGLLSYHKDKGKWEIYTVKQGLQNNEIRALAAGFTELWIATSQGMCVIQQGEKKIVRLESQELSSINDLALCGDTLFVATDFGWYQASAKDRILNYLDLAPGMISGKVFQLSVLNTQVWVATESGIMVYDTRSHETQGWLREIWMNQQTPVCIAAGNPYVWIGTENGFYRFQRDKNRWDHFDVKDGLLDNRVRQLTLDGDDLFICTPSGLTRYYWNNPARIK